MSRQILVQTPWGDTTCNTPSEVDKHIKIPIPASIFTAVKYHGATVYWGVLKFSAAPLAPTKQKCLTALQHESNLEETP